MKLKNILIVVKDIEKSKQFYHDLFGLDAVVDNDGNLILTEGLVLQDEKIWKEFLGSDIVQKSNSCELYFEECDIEEFIRKLERLYPSVQYVNRLMTHSWGQKVIRFYDLDGNLIEVGTPVITFQKFTDFPRGTLYDILQDAYSYDARNKEIWDKNWHESDDFFYDHPDIADRYGLVTCIGDMPIGFVTWDPRHRPEYVEIGHNGIRERYKRKGYGHMQLAEAVRRIKEYEGLQRIIVWTNSNLAAPKNYESVGFRLYDRKPNDSESAYTGDYLYYEIKC